MLKSKNMIINIVNGMTKVMLVNIVCDGKRHKKRQDLTGKIAFLYFKQNKLEIYH